MSTATQAPREVIEALGCDFIAETDERLGKLFWFRDRQTGSTLALYERDFMVEGRARFHLSVSRTSFYLSSQKS
jgi:hypothetical protein